MKRREIRWYRFSPPDKNRPVLILTRDSVVDLLGELTIAPITTTVREIPSEVFLSRDQDGMPHDCVVNLDHIQTVSKRKVGSLITTLTEKRMLEVRAAMLFALGF